MLLVLFGTGKSKYYQGETTVAKGTLADGGSKEGVDLAPPRGAVRDEHYRGVELF